MDVSEIVTKADIKQLKEDIFEELRKSRFFGAKAPLKKELLVV